MENSLKLRDTIAPILRQTAATQDEADWATNHIASAIEEKLAGMPIAHVEAVWLLAQKYGYSEFSSEPPMCYLERYVDGVKYDLESMHDFHDTCIKELYKMLDIDGSDGEFRFKWVSLELSNVLREYKKLKHAQKQLDLMEDAMLIHCLVTPPRNLDEVARKKWLAEFRQKKIDEEGMIPHDSDGMTFLPPTVENLKNEVKKLRARVADLERQMLGG